MQRADIRYSQNGSPQTRQRGWTRSLTGFAIIGSLTLTGCTSGLSGNDYARQEVGTVAQIDEGVIVSSRPVTVQNDQGSPIGTAAGGAIGAIGGSQLGNGGVGSAAAGIGLGIIGALIGSALGQKASQRQAVAYTVQLSRNNALISITQQDPFLLEPGTKVFIEYGARARIIPQDPHLTDANHGTTSY